MVSFYMSFIFFDFFPHSFRIFQCFYNLYWQFHHRQHAHPSMWKWMTRLSGIWPGYASYMISLCISFAFFSFFLHFIRYNTFVNATSIQQCSNPLLAPAVSSYTVGLVALNLGSEGWRWYLFRLVQCLGSGGSFRRVPPLASGTSTFVCRYWHLVDFGFWGLVPSCAPTGIWNINLCAPALASGWFWVLGECI